MFKEENHLSTTLIWIDTHRYT